MLSLKPKEFNSFICSWKSFGFIVTGAFSLDVKAAKAILSNVGAEKGKTMFDIYFSADDNAIVLKVHKNVAGENK